MKNSWTHFQEVSAPEICNSFKNNTMGNPQAKQKFTINKCAISYSKKKCKWVVRQSGIVIFEGKKWAAVRKALTINL